MTGDLYALLGVERTASADEIRRAYRRLARTHHPDVNPDDAGAEAKFKQVSAAYEVLSDDNKRRAYDEFGEASLQSGFDPERARAQQRWQSTGAQPDFDLSDLSDLFGFGRAARAPRRGADVQAVVDVELREAIRGGTTRFQVPGRKPVTVRIPPGADDGSTIRLEGRGAPGDPGAPAGDLVIVFRVRPHPTLERRGLNLHLRFPVTLDEAYNGAVVEVPTFDGPIKLTVPPLSQPGAKLRARGKGVRRGDQTGDLIVELQVRLPDVRDDQLSAAIQGARGAYTGFERQVAL